MRGGVHDGHPGEHVALGDRALGEGAHLGERDAVVDAEHQPLVRDELGRHERAAQAQQVERLRQVVLALSVLGGESRQHTEQRRAVEHVYAGVDLADLQLGVACVAGLLGLDDARDRPAGVAHDPAVAARVLEHGGGHRGGGAAVGVRLYELGDRVGADERNVAAEHDRRRAGLDQIGGRAHRPAGPVRALLHGQLDSLGQHVGKRPRRRIDHHDAPRAGRERGAHRPQHHRDAAQLVQNLRRGRAHTRTLACGQDQDGRGW